MAKREDLPTTATEALKYVFLDNLSAISKSDKSTKVLGEKTLDLSLFNGHEQLITLNSQVNGVFKVSFVGQAHRISS